MLLAGFVALIAILASVVTIFASTLARRLKSFGVIVTSEDQDGSANGERRERLPEAKDTKLLR